MLDGIGGQSYNIAIMDMQPTNSRKKVNGYIIYLNEPLGRGTYGIVYPCIEEASQCSYAVKVMEKSQCIARFRQSAVVNTWQKVSRDNSPFTVHCSIQILYEL